MQDVREEERSEHPLKCVKAMEMENIIRKVGSGFLLGSLFALPLRRFLFFLFRISSFPPFKFAVWLMPSVKL